MSVPKKIAGGCAIFAVLFVVIIVIVIAVAAGKSSTNTPAPSPVKSSQRAAGKSLSDGTYLIGKDIPAGTYTSPGPRSSGVLDACYWSRAKNSSGDLSSVIANDNITGPGRVTVKAGETVKFSGGCEWNRA